MTDFLVTGIFVSNTALTAGKRSIGSFGQSGYKIFCLSGLQNIRFKNIKLRNMNLA